MQTLKSIREELRDGAMKTAARYTQEALAAELGVSVPTMKALEENPLSMSVEQLTKACEYLGCDVDIFLRSNPN